MNFLGNVIWLFFGGLVNAASWFFVGCLWCVTIIGIPIGVQCFKIAGFVLWPFGKEVVYTANTTSFLINLLWMLFSGIWLAIEAVATGLVLCVTIIGIPFGLQCFKFARLALMPFGARVISTF